MELSSDEE